MNPADKILIIDDDDRNIFALKAVLTAKHFQCLTATSGLQALDILQHQQDIKTALVDMMMPGMDGYEFMSLVRSIPDLRHINLVAVTAQAMPGDKEKCITAGADGYLSKPVNVDQLLALLNDSKKEA